MINQPLQTLYDVQQLLKQFGIFVYVGSRIGDIDMMKIELQNLYKANLISKQIFYQANLVLRREYEFEQQRNLNHKKY